MRPGGRRWCEMRRRLGLRGGVRDYPLSVLWRRVCRGDLNTRARGAWWRLGRRCWYPWLLGIEDGMWARRKRRWRRLGADGKGCRNLPGAIHILPPANDGRMNRGRVKLCWEGVGSDRGARLRGKRSCRWSAGELWWLIAFRTAGGAVERRFLGCNMAHGRRPVAIFEVLGQSAGSGLFGAVDGRRNRRCGRLGVAVFPQFNGAPGRRGRRRLRGRQPRGAAWLKDRSVRPAGHLIGRRGRPGGLGRVYRELTAIPPNGVWSPPFRRRVRRVYQDRRRRLDGSRAQRRGVRQSALGQVTRGLRYLGRRRFVDWWSPIVLSHWRCASDRSRVRYGGRFGRGRRVSRRRRGNGRRGRSGWRRRVAGLAHVLETGP